MKEALYRVGDDLEIISSVSPNSVKGNSWKKRLNVQSLLRKEINPVSGKYLLLKIGLSLSLLREKVRNDCQKIFGVRDERTAEAMLMSDISVLQQSTQLELNQTGIASFFQSVTLKIFFISDVLFFPLRYF